MRVLAIDTALDACSAAYVTVDAAGGAQAAAVASEPMAKGHAERLMPMLADLRAEAGWGGPVDRIVVTVGPGTFTGARVGLAAARAMALAWDCPCLGVSSLEALAASATTPIRLAAHDARRGQYYAQLFMAGGAALTEPLAVDAAGVWSRVQALAPPGTHCIGSGAAALVRACPADRLTALERAVPDPVVLARFALDDPAERPARPVYLRPPDAVPAKPPAWQTAP